MRNTVTGQEEEPTPLGIILSQETHWYPGDLDSIRGLGRSPGQGKGYPLQYSGLENSTDCAGFPGGSAVKNPPTMQELQERQVWSLGQEEPLEKGIATHPNFLAWRTAWTQEPGGLQSTGSHGVGRNWSDLADMHHQYRCAFCSVAWMQLRVGWVALSRVEALLEKKMNWEWNKEFKAQVHIPFCNLII